MDFFRLLKKSSRFGIGIFSPIGVVCVFVFIDGYSPMGRHRTRPVARCIFCPNKPDSREHVWPDWVLRRFGRFTFGPIRHSIQGGQEFTTDPMQRAIKVRCVCKHCNEVWMKAMEDAVIPTAGSMMSDLALWLDIPQQWAIAKWAVKTAMVHEFSIREKPTIFFTDEARCSFRSTDDIPAGVSVFLARSSAPEPFYTEGGDLSAVRPEIGEVHGHVFTLSFRYLAVQVLAARAPQKPRAIVRVDGNAADTWWNVATIPIWPADGTVRWPPQRSIANASIPMDRFTGHWVHP